MVRTQRSGGGQQRVRHLEKTLRFLSEQHVDTLRQLHREAEGLKKENRGAPLLRLALRTRFDHCSCLCRAEVPASHVQVQADSC